MNQPDMFAQSLSKALRDQGIKRAVDHAGDEWKDRAYRIFISFVKLNGRQPFMTEDVRMYAGHAIEEPPDRRAWGHIAVKAARAGLIMKIGYAPHKDPSRHNGPSTIWRAK